MILVTIFIYLIGNRDDSILFTFNNYKSWISTHSGFASIIFTLPEKLRKWRDHPSGPACFLSLNSEACIELLCLVPPPHESVSLLRVSRRCSIGLRAEPNPNRRPRCESCMSSAGHRKSPLGTQHPRLPVSIQTCMDLVSSVND